MVIRDASEGSMSFRFNTDTRSPKVAQVDAGSAVSFLGYDPQERVQLTVRGTGRIEQSDNNAQSAWDASALSSRRCYLAANPPGTIVPKAMSGLPDFLTDRAPTETESELGRANFCVLFIEATELEWLKLTSCGNKRAVFTRNDNSWSGHWITP
jgi:hypothetical protein